MTDTFLTTAEKLAQVIRETAPHLGEEFALDLGVRLAEIDLDKFNTLWSRRKTAFPDHLSLVEGRVIGALIDVILADPANLIEVHDECEMAVKATRDRAAIEKETAATGITYFVVYRRPAHCEGQERQGFIMLVHGNEDDVLTDYTDKPFMHDLVTRTEARVEEVS